MKKANKGFEQKILENDQDLSEEEKNKELEYG